ncbi:hypothetical protein Pmar_PMAR020086, partial [Perkinsus marinus ATCC 50983]
VEYRARDTKMGGRGIAKPFKLCNRRLLAERSRPSSPPGRSRAHPVDGEHREPSLVQTPVRLISPDSLEAGSKQ